MPNEWQETTWGKLAILEYGKALRNYRNSSGAFRVYGTNGPIGWTTEPLCSDATVIVGRKGAYRGIHYSQKPCFVIDTAFYLKPLVEFDMRWAYYALLTYDLNSMDSGSAIPSTNRDAFYQIPIKVPPIAEQRAIAHILGTLDDKIELNRRMNETLEQMARALFKAWFVDFEPVRAKMEGRWKRGQSLPGMPAHLYDLFPDRLVDSKLGKIPEGWQIGKIGDIIMINRDSIYPSKYPNELFNHYSIPAYDDGKMPIPQLGAEIKSNKFIVPNESVLLSKLNPRIPRIWLTMSFNSLQNICSTEFIVALPNKNSTREYIYALFSSPDFLRCFSSLVTGTSGSHQRVKPDSLLSIDIVVPQIEVIASFTKMVAPFYKCYLANQLQSTTIASLRDVLLPKLMSGEIRLREVERYLEERGV